MSKYEIVPSVDYDQSGSAAAAAAGASYASMATTAVATAAVAGATAGIYYATATPLEAVVVLATCHALPTCTALGFF